MIAFDNLPAGSIVLAKRYNLWQRFKSWLTGKKLNYNDVFVDPFGHSWFMFQNTFWNKWDIYSFTPKKSYSKKESIALTQLMLRMGGDNIARLLSINLVRPNTLSGITLEELFDDNKYYNKTKVA